MGVPLFPPQNLRILNRDNGSRLDTNRRKCRVLEDEVREKITLLSFGIQKKRNIPPTNCFILFGQREKLKGDSSNAKEQTLGKGY